MILVHSVRSVDRRSSTPFRLAQLNWHKFQHLRTCCPMRKLYQRWRAWYFDIYRKTLLIDRYKLEVGSIDRNRQWNHDIFKKRNQYRLDISKNRKVMTITNFFQNFSSRVIVTINFIKVCFVPNCVSFFKIPNLSFQLSGRLNGNRMFVLQNQMHTG